MLQWHGWNLEVMLIKSRGTQVDGNPQEVALSQQLRQGPHLPGQGLTVREQQQDVHQSQHRRAIPAERRDEGRVRRRER